MLPGQHFSTGFLSFIPKAHSFPRLLGRGTAGAVSSCAPATLAKSFVRFRVNVVERQLHWNDWERSIDHIVARRFCSHAPKGC
jgi:hypothetical protein